MSRRLLVVLAIGAIAVAAIGSGWWITARTLSRRTSSTPAPGTPAPAAPAADARKITATLYYVSEDGMSLVGVHREVAFGDTVIEQARQIVIAQLAVAPQPLISAIPAETTLRALYLTDRGDAFVDLSPDVRTKHTGGALDELFTVYSIVNALTTNLPAVKRVQILIEGQEVDTLAGHVDLRHPLQKNLKWVKTEKGDT
jgi:spore germination protein GerM